MNIDDKPIHTLSGGKVGYRVTLPVQVRAQETTGSARKRDPLAATELTEPAVLEFVASNGSIDRYGERIDPNGWRLDPYRRNPVFLNSHKYGDITNVIGRALATDVRIHNNQLCLYQRIEFAIDVNPLARVAYGLYKGRFVTAVSVGFIPLAWKDSEQDGQTIRTYTAAELVEVSAVAVPANRDSLLACLQPHLTSPGTIRDGMRILAQAFMDSQAKYKPGLAQPALLNLARDLRAAMTETEAA